MPKKKKQPTHGGARPGAGRPRTYVCPATPTSVQLEQAMIDRLDERAKTLGINRSAAIQAAIAAWLGGAK